MVQIGEQESVIETVEKNSKQSLLNKFDIPLDHLDFKYIENCNNAKEIEQIVQILRSGEEGHYPDLQKCAENRLTILKPNSKLLRTSVPILTKCDLPKSEWENLTCDMESWIDNINKNDKELASFQDIKPNVNNAPIRQSHQIKKPIDSKTERIKSMDYKSWDKLDVDAEMLKMDLHEEKVKQEAIKKAEQIEKLNTVVVDPDVMTEAELKHASEQAKNVGNEAFRMKEFEEALEHYTNSVTIYPTVVGFNNRAITNIKLKKFEDALNDCDEVLKVEAYNQKALLRKAEALKSLKRYKEAVETLENSLRINPNQFDVQKLLSGLQKKSGCDAQLKTVRLKIEETATKMSDNKYIHNAPRKALKRPITKFKNILIPIPSTSTYMGPSYKIERVSIEVAEKYEKTTKKTPAKSDEHVINLNLVEEEYVPKRIDNSLQRFNNELMFLSNQFFNNQMRYHYIDEGSGEGKHCNSSDDDDDKFEFDFTNPYEFVKCWQAIKTDVTLFRHEQLLRNLAAGDCEMATVIGNKLDADMFSLLIKCLATRFQADEDIPLIGYILTELTKVQRFHIIMMLISPYDKEILWLIIKHVQSDFNFDQQVYSKYYYYCLSS